LLFGHAFDSDAWTISQDLVREHKIARCETEKVRCSLVDAGNA